MDVMTPEQRHRNMVAIKSKDTQIEVVLRKALWNKGIRYRKNMRLYNCHPDIVITKYKIAVFCDGDFWHGNTLEKYDVKTNTKFWHEKIKRNVERDLENTIELRDNGWIVMRFWESEILNKLEDCVSEVVDSITKNSIGSFDLRSYYHEKRKE